MYAMVVGPLSPLALQGRSDQEGDRALFKTQKEPGERSTTGSLKCEVELPAGKGAFAATMRPFILGTRPRCCVLGGGWEELW